MTLIGVLLALLAAGAASNAARGQIDSHVHRAGQLAFHSLRPQTEADKIRQIAIARLLLGPPGSRQTEFKISFPGTCSIGGAKCNARTLFSGMDERWVTQADVVAMEHFADGSGESAFEDEYCFHKPGSPQLPLRDFCVTVSSHSLLHGARFRIVAVRVG